MRKKAGQRTPHGAPQPMVVSEPPPPPGVEKPKIDPTYREQFVSPTPNKRVALERLYWFYRMVDCGGPDGSELDELMEAEAQDAAEFVERRRLDGSRRLDP